MQPYEAHSFTEPSEYAASIRGADIDLTVFGRGPFLAKTECINLGSLRLQRFSERVPRVLHSTSDVQRAPFVFLTEPGRAIIRNGIEISSTRLARAPVQRSLFQRSFGSVKWGSLSLPVEGIHSLAMPTAGVDLAPPRDEQVINCRPNAMATLQRLHAAAARFAQEVPDMIGNPELTRGMEQMLIQALLGCLDSSDVHRPPLRHHRHRTIMRRFYAVLELYPDRAIYVLEMAKAVGAPLRTLTECCREHLGMSPKKYLLLRRMHLARQALINPDASASTVTDVAARFGFWQFGRFAGEYKSLFGETPSATLSCRREY
jgi:AraC-like DNA-binding protein